MDDALQVEDLESAPNYSTSLQAGRRYPPLRNARRLDASTATLRDCPSDAEPFSVDPQGDTMVCVRVRPLLPAEQERGLYSAVEARNPRVFVQPAKQVANRTALATARVSSFDADLAFGPSDSNDTVYDTVKPLLPFALDAGVAVVFAFGQTGSGKTHTMNAMGERLAMDLFSLASSRNPTTASSAAAGAEFEFRVSYIEIFGPKVSDLLSDHNAVSIAEDAFGEVQILGVREEPVSSSAEMVALFSRGAAFRRTEATAKNDASSRSHAVARVRITNRRVPELEDGLLYLVDLAGSESAADVVEHSRERLRETKDINASLAVLKDCIRNRALAAVGSGAHVHVPYRGSKLTLLLKDVFELGSKRQCRTVVFANVSPSDRDTSATLNTLRYIQPLRVPLPKTELSTEPNPKDPATWTNHFLRAWVAAQYPAVDPVVLCPTETGRQLLRVPEGEFVRRCLACPGVTEKRAHALHVKLWGLLVDARTKERTKKLQARPQKKQSLEAWREIDRAMANMAVKETSQQTFSIRMK